MRSVLQNLPEHVRSQLEQRADLDKLEDVRLRVSQPAEIRANGANFPLDGVVDAAQMRHTIACLAEHSIYAREDEMRQGFFTIKGGCRVGLTGRFAQAEGKITALTHIGSICIRIAREIKGCASGLMDQILRGGRPLGALIVSPPGMGKTTMLRDIARQLSIRGFHVAIADERGEIAGCIDGVPTMDLGPRCDVADGLEKRIAMAQLLRSMAPDVMITDELGRAGDADAVRDAARSGTKVIASAHGEGLEDILGREAIAELWAEGLFERMIVLGGSPGRVRSIHARGTHVANPPEAVCK